jgi:hypothetical protein
MAWIAPLHLRLRLRWQRSDEPGQNASHGWLNDDGQLVLLQTPLRRQLQQCPGYAEWRASGGELHLASESQP